MKHLTILLMGLLLTACLKDNGSEEAEEKAPPKALPPMLAAQGCSVSKTHGVLKVVCSDGSQAEAGAPSYYIKDANGVDLNDLTFLQGASQAGLNAINKKSGHILVYNNYGNMVSISRINYTTNDCTGTMYSPITTFAIKNRIILNTVAGPSTVEAYRVVGFEPGSIVVNSKYEGGVCSTVSETSSWNSIIVADELDDTDPPSIAMPFEIVISE